MSPESKSAYTCPVCGYPSLPREPYLEGQYPSFDMCPCCGTEFGYDDEPGASGVEVPFDGDREQDPEGFRQAAFRMLRRGWVKEGMKWSLPAMPPPADWNAAEQLRRIELEQ